MTHPCLVTLDRDSASRVLFAGDQLVESDLPEGSRVLYPKPPLAPLPDVDAAIRRALAHPVASDPLRAKLRPGMRATVALDDLSAFFPRMATPDVRQRVLEIVLELLADHAVDDIEIIIATGLGRRLKAREVRRMVGERVFRSHWPKRLYSHDAEDPERLVVLSETEYGEVVELNRRAAESDLLITIAANFLPLHGGHHLVCSGLGSYRSVRAHYNSTVLRRSYGYMDPEASGFATTLARTGKLVDESLDVFSIAATLDNRTFGKPLDLLAKNEDDLSERDRLLLGGLVASSARLPVAARRAVFERMPASYAVTGVFAGETGAVFERARERQEAQYLVPVDRQADVLIMGIPYATPFSVGTHANPLLVQLMAEGIQFNLYKGAPLVKKGGTLVLTHPCTDRFDHEQHAPYIDFVHRLLPETRDGLELERRYEQKFAKNPAFLEMYRKGHCYHPAQPFFAWYLGEAGRNHLGKVIVVGADNEYVPKLLGYETAPNVDEALYRARGGQPRSLDVLCLHSPPLVMGDLRAAVSTSSEANSS